MNEVQPIRDKQKLDEIKDYLRATSPRDYLLFIMGVNTALRISDLLKLRVRDVRGNHITLRQGKTGGGVRHLINPAMREALELYFSAENNGDNPLELSPNQLLFPGRGKDKPLSGVRVWKMVQKWTDMVGLDEGGPNESERID